jgi:uncharacterized protein YjiS (DUF1127 family)
MRTPFRPRLGERHLFARSETGLAERASHAIRVLRSALLARRQRRALLALDDRMLADIGLSRSQAYHEGGRAFLDVPRDLM